MSTLPTISLVTVNFNYAQFLRATLDSVLEQNYPHLEYLVLDAGSTDESVSIIQEKASRLAYWISESDAGQSDALNRGFKRTTGEIVGWLNSDDLHLPDTLRRVGTFFQSHPEIDWITAPCKTIDADGQPLGLTPVSSCRDLAAFVSGLYFPQPSTFWRRRLHSRVGWLAPHLHLTFDQDFWARLAIANTPLAVLDEPLSIERLHPLRKTACPGTKLTRERLTIAKSHIHHLPHDQELKVRSTIRILEHRLLRSPFYESPNPNFSDLMRLVCAHPALLAERPTWGLIANFLRPKW